MKDTIRVTTKEALKNAVKAKYNTIIIGGACAQDFGGANPPDERKGALPMVTYTDLIQFCIFIVALVGLCYQIFKGKRK